MTELTGKILEYIMAFREELDNDLKGRRGSKVAWETIASAGGLSFRLLSSATSSQA